MRGNSVGWNFNETFYNVSFLGPALKSRTPFQFILKWTKINFEFFSFRGPYSFQSENGTTQRGTISYAQIT
ncbi:hypothetical protein RIR_jg39464.t1 [Rhizophagus irregularis DAOM 181602=DAOM 197198]|nr:hypothetical protein RIR_jg39464.t1 [Rhizophagus irregularis DAOM 181602=DAOM 197198]CAB5179757.1 unnamed protein product [Rhizophagus irregularis]